MEKLEAFWMVYGEGCTQPTKKHDTEQLAITEAERLARLKPGITFTVLRAICCCVKKDVDWRDYEYIPF
jgi:hypothetical protein